MLEVLPPLAGRCALRSDAELRLGQRRASRKFRVRIGALALGHSDHVRPEEPGSPPPNVALKIAARFPRRRPRMPSLAAGTVTFLFTDIEGSTTLLQRLGDRRDAEVP